MAPNIESVSTGQPFTFMVMIACQQVPASCCRNLAGLSYARLFYKSVENPGTSE